MDDKYYAMYGDMLFYGVYESRWLFTVARFIFIFIPYGLFGNTAL